NEVVHPSLHLTCRSRRKCFFNVRHYPQPTTMPLPLLLDVTDVEGAESIRLASSSFGRARWSQEYDTDSLIADSVALSVDAIHGTESGQIPLRLDLDLNLDGRLTVCGPGVGVACLASSVSDQRQLWPRSSTKSASFSSVLLRESKSLDHIASILA